MKAAWRGQLGTIARAVLGRRNAIRFGQLLLDAGRLDVLNDMASNGEELVQECVLRSSSRDKTIVVFDAGANVGRWTAQILRMAPSEEWPKLQVHAFEPALATHQRLLENLDDWGLRDRVVPVRRGLSGERGTANLFLAHALAGSNSMHRSALSDSESIELTTLDLYTSDQGISQIRFLKCDLEGHDLFALEGGRRLLERGAIDVIQFEYNLRWIDSRRFLCDAFDLLLPLGYVVGKITVQGIAFCDTWHPDLETFREANFLACRPQWKDRFPTVR